MDQVIRFVGPDRTLEIIGVRLVGVNAENGTKLLFSLLFVLFVLAVSWILRWLARSLPKSWLNQQLAFWMRQIIRLLATVLLVLGLVSIWFDDPNRLTSALGLIGAGVAVALQKAITSLAGYFVILRGRTFRVGDRIVMGGVRGDVIDLGFMQTTILEMGEPPAVQAADPAVWVRSRQYTGRLVTVTNDKLFDEPVFNYSREFPFIWEEMMTPITYKTDWRRAEGILLDVAGRHTVQIAELSEDHAQELQRRYFVTLDNLRPRVFLRLTDNWVELTVRFICRTHEIRELKDRMARDILREFDQAGIGIASSTYDVVGLPPVEVHLNNHSAADRIEQSV